MPTEKDKILKYSHEEKSLKVPVTYYSHIECLFKQIDTCHNNREQTSTTRVSKLDPCGIREKILAIDIAILEKKYLL